MSFEFVRLSCMIDFSNYWKLIIKNKTIKLKMLLLTYFDKLFPGFSFEGREYMFTIFFR